MHVISTGAVDGFTVRCAVERPLYFASHGSAADSNSQSAFDSSGYKKIGCPILCAQLHKDGALQNRPKYS